MAGITYPGKVVVSDGPAPAKKEAPEKAAKKAPAKAPARKTAK